MEGDFFDEAVAAMHSFRSYMEQIIFDSSQLLGTATFLENLSEAFDFLRVDYLFHHPNCSRISLLSQ